MQRAPELDIVACGSGKEAMSSARRFEFEIITTGITLPDTDGFFGEAWEFSDHPDGRSEVAELVVRPRLDLHRGEPRS